MYVSDCAHMCTNVHISIYACMFVLYMRMFVYSVKRGEACRCEENRACVCVYICVCINIYRGGSLLMRIEPCLSVYIYVYIQTYFVCLYLNAHIHA
jgi:hypothetical protein